MSKAAQQKLYGMPLKKALFSLLMGSSSFIFLDEFVKLFIAPVKLTWTWAIGMLLLFMLGGYLIGLLKWRKQQKRIAAMSVQNDQSMATVLAELSHKMKDEK